jgi:hypothetical protein
MPSTSSQAGNLEDRRQALYKKIKVFYSVQASYMPQVASLKEGLLQEADFQPETTPLFLPSSVPAETRSHPLLDKLSEVEKQLRCRRFNNPIPKNAN